MLLGVIMTVKRGWMSMACPLKWEPVLPCLWWEGMRAGYLFQVIFTAWGRLLVVGSYCVMVQLSITVPYLFILWRFLSKQEREYDTYPTSLEGISQEATLTPVSTPMFMHLLLLFGAGTSPSLHIGAKFCFTPRAFLGDTNMGSPPVTSCPQYSLFTSVLNKVTELSPDNGELVYTSMQMGASLTLHLYHLHS